MNDNNANKLNTVIVIPSYNEGDRVEQVVREVKSLGFNRIVIVDDHSSDDSMKNLRKYDVAILHHMLNRGAGAATETGLKFCREHLHFNTVITIDADTQHAPSDLNQLLEEHLSKEADVTIGNRFLENSDLIPTDKRIYNYIANLTTSILCGKRVTDSQSGFKAFSKKALDVIVIEHDQYEYCSEIFIKAFHHHLKVINVPVKSYYPDELKGKGQNLTHGIKTFMNLINSVMFKNN
jgi:UDP-N-acetylglucosamine---dolichyl-phosphate N-acetylglucosaminyltransferase